VLGASPREFESRILRHADLQKRRSWMLACRRPRLPWAHLMGSFAATEGSPLQGSIHLFCLVTGIADVPEQRGARRRSVLGCKPSRVQISHPGLHSSEFCEVCGHDRTWVLAVRRADRAGSIWDWPAVDHARVSHPKMIAERDCLAVTSRARTRPMIGELDLIAALLGRAELAVLRFLGDRRRVRPKRQAAELAAVSRPVRPGACSCPRRPVRPAL